MNPANASHRLFAIFALLLCLASGDAAAQSTAVITRTAALDIVRQLSDPDVGAAQGVSLHDGQLYVYGDWDDGTIRAGVIKEYTIDGAATGRRIRLTRDGYPVIVHPTGLTWHPEFGCFIGDTVNGRGRIYQLDWPRALADGDLDAAIRAEVDDDAAVNGTRPEYVMHGQRVLLATADYGDVDPQLRLYDPRRLVAAGRSNANGVIVAHVRIGPFNQNLCWDGDTGRLVCVQNTTAGRGWRLDTLDVERAVAAGSAEAPGVRIRQQVFDCSNELEGLRNLPDGATVFVTSGHEDNIMFARIHDDP